MISQMLSQDFDKAFPKDFQIVSQGFRNVVANEGVRKWKRNMRPKVAVMYRWLVTYTHGNDTKVSDYEAALFYATSAARLERTELRDDWREHQATEHSGFKLQDRQSTFRTLRRWGSSHHRKLRLPSTAVIKRPMPNLGPTTEGRMEGRSAPRPNVFTNRTHHAVAIAVHSAGYQQIDPSIMLCSQLFVEDTCNVEMVLSRFLDYPSNSFQLIDEIKLQPRRLQFHQSDVAVDI